MDSLSIFSTGVPDVWENEFDNNNFDLYSRPPNPSTKIITYTILVPSNASSANYNFNVFYDNVKKIMPKLIIKNIAQLIIKIKN